jgi:hypothetical protein
MITLLISRRVAISYKVMVNATENWSSVMWRLFVSPATRALPMFLSGWFRYVNKVLQGDVRSILQPCGCQGLKNLRSTIVKPLTKNDKRSEREMNAEK